MGSVSIVHGGSLQTSVRALVLARDLRAPLRARLTQAPSGARVSLVRAPAVPELQKQLSARGVVAYAVEASDLCPAQNVRIDLDDGRGTATWLDTITLPGTLPREGMTVAVASCFYDGFRMGERLAAALRQVRLVTPPLLQFWSGDNVYLDVPSVRQFDAPFGRVLDRYLQYLEGSPYARARALHPNYTTFDDHEFWNNFPEFQAWLQQSWPLHREGFASAMRACLTLFQSGINPPPLAVAPSGAAATRSFAFAVPPLSFFFLDGRSARTTYADGRGTMLAPGDLAAFEAWARGLTGPGVLVVGQPLWIEPGNAFDYNPPAYSREYQAIFRALRDAPFDVLVVSGDVHHSRLLRLSLRDAPGRALYEFVTSPASHIPTIASSMGFGSAQGRATLSLPGTLPESGQAPRAEAYFASSVPNTFGLLRFIPRPNGEVGVGAAFVDYAGERPAFAPIEPCGPIPRIPSGLTRCAAEELFVLRRRA